MLYHFFSKFFVYYTFLLPCFALLYLSLLVHFAFLGLTLPYPTIFFCYNLFFASICCSLRHPFFSLPKSLSPNFCLDIILNSFFSSCSFLRTVFSLRFSLMFYVCSWLFITLALFWLFSWEDSLLINCLCLNSKVVFNFISLFLPAACLHCLISI